MEHENMYASNGKGNLGVTLGAIGTGLGVLGGGLNGLNLFGNAPRNAEEHLVNRYEATQNARIAELETEVKLRDSNIYTDSKILELYKYVDGKVACLENQLCEQRVYNATLNSTVACIQGQIAQLASLTKIVIPNASICPGWTTTTTGA